eukprot:TRINITY_DN7756_c0_g1_i1.p4 TRINITY_DN7756_c0_g1~~TRINITY_DN7756_c0_g1_i1.p4  ORF type:complete len:185 (-),score=31.32 TRINITY_DN7756_c0_g1_i1:6097-6651(-)
MIAIRSIIIDGHAEGYGGVELIVNTSLRILDSGKKDGKFERMFRALRVREKQQMIPIETLRNLWGLESLEHTENAVNQLDDDSLVRKLVFDGRKLFIQLHNLILGVAARKACEKCQTKAAYCRLINNYIAEAHERKKRREGTDGEIAMGTPLLEGVFQNVTCEREVDCLYTLWKSTLSGDEGKC